MFLEAADYALTVEHADTGLESGSQCSWKLLTMHSQWSMLILDWSQVVKIFISRQRQSLWQQAPGKGKNKAAGSIAEMRPREGIDLMAKERQNLQ